MGEMFGRYRLEQQLGAGGVGEVWRALDTSLDRVVALKMLLPRFRDDPESEARFHREARLAARLRHPHIVRVHAFGEVDRRLFLDMELVEGESLAAALDRGGPFDPARVVDVVERIAEALDVAHALALAPERRMVHRDVKPANILAEPRPRGREHVYLVDFGVARTVAAGTAITGVGSIVGTPAYMAPELWEGRHSDHRVDVYALAVTAFELLTGDLPYRRESLEGVLTAHLTEPVPRPSQWRRGLPTAVDAVLARGMAKDPGRRFRTAGDLAHALAEALRPAPAVVAPTVALRTPSQVEPHDPTRPGPARPRSGRSDPPPGDPEPGGASPRGYLASPVHFAGLATTALLLPLHLTGLVPADWTLLPVLLLLYALGAVVAAVLRPRSP